MKTFFLAVTLLFSLNSLADGAYTLNQICQRYGDSQASCRRVPFCDSRTTPGIQAGCHAVPGMEYVEQLCQNFDRSLCNPAAGCQYSDSGTRPLTQCFATRTEL